jgi:pimeloyl-ACP methyl ester carboxylesterase
VRSLCLLLLLPLLSGCYFSRRASEPVLGLETRVSSLGRTECLIVFMPGFLDEPDEFTEQGFVEDALRAGSACDMVAVDAHFGYYRSNAVARRVGEDVLQLATMRGYERIWVVGISMGGLGTSLLAARYQHLVDGVILLAPFLGDAEVPDAVREAGGLAAWEVPDGASFEEEDRYTEALWGWFKGYAEDPEDRPALYLGAGSEDQLGRNLDLLAAHLPEGHLLEAEGGHRWPVWRQLWRQLLADPPWG